MIDQMKSGNWMNVLRLMGLTNKVKFICDVEGLSTAIIDSARVKEENNEVIIIDSLPHFQRKGCNHEK